MTRLIPQSLINKARLKKYELITPKIPTHVFIELTNRCGYSCKMCPRLRMNREIGDMSIYTFQRVIDQMGDSGIKKANLYLYGDPVLNKHLLEMIRYAKQKGINTTLETTGFSLKIEDMPFLISTGLDNIYFSVHGATKEAYQAAHGVDGFVKVIDTIHRFIETKKDMGSLTPKITVQCAYMETNKDTYDEIKEMFNKKDVSLSLTECTFNTETNINDLRVIKKVRVRKEPCVEIYTSLAVSWDGNITVCCNDMDFSLKIGDVYSTTLKEAFNSEKIKKLRRHLKNPKTMPKICQGC